MAYRRNLLIFISILLVALVWNIPFYNKFIVSRIIFPDESADFFYQKDHMDLEERKTERFGVSYPMFRDMANDFSNKSDVVLLLPPAEYITAMHFDQVAIPEPCEFYYFTGVNAVNINSPNVRQANWAMETIPGSIGIVPITTPGHLDTLIALYTPYNKINQ